MTARRAVKRALQAAALALVLPAAAVSGFGRLRVVYAFFAQSLALAPGFPGIFLRAAFYRMTLRRCSIDVSVHFGTVFVDPAAEIAPLVSVGSYCVIGRARIGARTQISSGVQIPSGRHEHARAADGSLDDAPSEEIPIGAGCWIGAAAIVMAPVGAGSTIGAGAVVVKEIPPDSVAAGNPARVIRAAQAV